MSRNLISQDLSNYSLQDLAILAKYHDISPNDILAQELAPKIMAKARITQKKAYMVGSEATLPYGGDLGKARVAGDRAAIKEIMRWQREKRESELEPEPEPEIVEEAQDCSNDTDYITQEKWTEKPDIKIHFLDPNDLSKKPYTVCLDKTSLTKWMRDNNNYHARWIPKDPKKGMDSMGHGGAPNLKRIYLRLPDGVTYVINSPLRLGYEQFGIPLEQNVRVGGLKGSFGIGEMHGQEPGYTIYQLIPSHEYTRENIIKVFMDYLLKDRKTPFKKQQQNPQKDFIEAVRRNEFASVKRLLESPHVDPARGNNYAIQKASEEGYIDIVRLLLDDPRVDPTDDDNNDAIISANEQNHNKVVDLLLADKRVNESLLLSLDDPDKENLFDILKVLLNNATINNETPIVDYIKKSIQRFSQQGDYSLFFVQISGWTFGGLYDRQEFIEAMENANWQEYILAPPFNPPTEIQKTHPPSTVELKDIVEEISGYSDSYVDLAIHYWDDGVLRGLLKEMLSKRLS